MFRFEEGTVVKQDAFYFNVANMSVHVDAMADDSDDSGSGSEPLEGAALTLRQEIDDIRDQAQRPLVGRHGVIPFWKLPMIVSDWQEPVPWVQHLLLDAARRVQNIIPAPGSLPTGTGADKSKEVVADVKHCTTHTKFNMAIRQLIGWTGQKAPIDKLG